MPQKVATPRTTIAVTNPSKTQSNFLKKEGRALKGFYNRFLGNTNCGSSHNTFSARFARLATRFAISAQKFRFWLKNHYTKNEPCNFSLARG